MEHIKKPYEEFEEFLDVIRNKNRFFIPQKFLDIFDEIINQCKELIKPGVELYRCRIHNDNGRDEEPYKNEEIGIPPSNILSVGRINPRGINYLYTAGSKETAIAEVRPNIGDYVSIGKFKTKKHLEVVKLDKDMSVVGYVGDESKMYIEFICQFLFYFNVNSCKVIKESEKELEYLPTQIFAEYCKNKKLDGIMYPSSVSNANVLETDVNKPIQGYNYVFFSEEGLDYIDSKKVEIKSIKYGYDNK
ncbi:RES family NAD+ phosphorylase [Clostridium sardiniense]|uniref:RES family NAD+ phosphorylase n=1 Tax=Clostridium sardiniense TaxID=29369 RepID=UPI003D325F6F